jgi:hypothetical protein
MKSLLKVKRGEVVKQMAVYIALPAAPRKSVPPTLPRL